MLLAEAEWVLMWVMPSFCEKGVGGRSRSDMLDWLRIWAVRLMLLVLIEAGGVGGIFIAVGSGARMVVGFGR